MRNTQPDEAHAAIAGTAGVVDPQPPHDQDSSPDLDAAYQVKGNKAAVARIHFGQAHQQYFTPRWAAEAMRLIAEKLHDTQHNPDSDRVVTPLSVIDPTTGSGRLLAPFAHVGHHVFGVELDERLVPVARRAAGKENVHQGDICQYARVLPTYSWDVVVTNPPYALWWEVPDDSPMAGYELRKANSIESQAMVLELSKNLLKGSGLLLALVSGNLFDTYGGIAQFIKKHFQLVSLYRLPRPFTEYNIAVDGLLIVGVKKDQYTDKTPVEVQDWEGGENAEALAEAVYEAYKAQNTQTYYHFGYKTRVNHLCAYGYRHQVPELSMVVQVETGAPKIKLTCTGLRPANDWAGAWMGFYRDIPLSGYSQAEGCDADLMQAYGSLPNVLIAGVEKTAGRVRSLGFDAQVSGHDARQIEIAARRFARERIPIRELAPMEYLAYYNDGPITAKADVTIGSYRVQAGQTYELRARWMRADEVAKTTAVGEGKEGYVLREYIDRGYMSFRFTDAGGAGFSVQEKNVKDVEAMIAAFGLPQVTIVDDTADFHHWEVEVQRVVDRQAAVNGGKRPYPTQHADIVRFATKRAIACLWEQGGGKTNAVAFWAEARRYQRKLFVTPPSVVPGVLEDLHDRWGFKVRRLSHQRISQVRGKMRAYRRFWQDRRDAKTQLASRQKKLSKIDDAILSVGNGLARRLTLGAADMSDLLDALRELRERTQAEVEALQRVIWSYNRREALQAELAPKRRHLRNLREIEAKGKSRPGIDDEIKATVAELTRINEQLKSLPQAPKKPDVFFVSSYTDISQGDHLGIFDEWQCDHFDKEGDYLGTATNTRARCHECGKGRKMAVPACPKCGAPWRGEGDGGGRVCRRCGHVAWTMGTSWMRNAENEPIKTPHRFPLAARAKKLFSCVMLDEAQDAKSKLSLMGAAARAYQANGKALLTGTWMKGYVIDLFWTAGWLFGMGGPMWPFPHRGGSSRFIRQFGTFKYLTKEFADSLQVGKRKLIPSVSNLNRLWRLIGPASIRRVKEDFLKDLPAKTVEVHWVGPKGKHADLVADVEAAIREVLEREMRKPQEQMNMGAISAALWWGRYVASCPTELGCHHYSGAYGLRLENPDKAKPAEIKAIRDQMKLEDKVLSEKEALSFVKMTAMVEIVKKAQAQGDKVIVFTSLRGLYRQVELVLKRHDIPYTGMDGVPTKKRNGVARAFEAGDDVVLLAGTGTLNRGVTITGANHVIILNTEWSPEVTLQAEDRIHRPGQTKPCYVHYILCSDTTDADVWELIQQKHAAQRAVQDREAQFKDVGELLEEAALANAQLAVARKMYDRLSKTPQPANADKADKPVSKPITDTQLVETFGGLRPKSPKSKRGKSKVLVVSYGDIQQLSLFDPKPETEAAAVLTAQTTGPVIVQSSFF